MNNVLVKKQSPILDKILEYYIQGQSDTKGIGLEYERISLDTNTFLQADFENLFLIMKEFSIINDWELIRDKNTIIGAKSNDGSSISLEPGGQFEISLKPLNRLFEIHALANKYVSQLDRLGDIYNTKFFAIGLNPKCCYQNMQILNKRRYKLMADYLFKKGKFAPVMMRETAGVQINIDYKNEIDAKRKMHSSLLMSPFLTGFFANSPFRNNKQTNYKSFRALAWKYTDPDRCALFYKDFMESDQPDTYTQYMNAVLNVPLMFIIRDDKYININGKITFNDFIKDGYMGFSATLDDYILHQSLCFPDVRLKNCIEIRNHDSQNLDIAIGIGGIYKGILYQDSAIDEIINFLKPLNYGDLNLIGLNAAKFGVNYKIDKLKMTIADVVKKILLLAQYNLPYEEQKYLDFLIDLVNSKRCIADLILETIQYKS